MSDSYTEKLRQYADLVVPFTECPFGEPIHDCPFIVFHRIGDESKQIAEINLHSEEELDSLRAFHRACMQKYINGEWETKASKKTVS